MGGASSRVAAAPLVPVVWLPPQSGTPPQLHDVALQLLADEAHGLVLLLCCLRGRWETMSAGRGHFRAASTNIHIK